MNVFLSSQVQLQKSVQWLRIPGVQVVLGVLLLFASSQILIPLKPVPITLQSMMALFLGLTSSPGRVAGIFSLWIGLGVCGLPMFNQYSFGFARLTGPTGGYIAGMFLAALVLSCLKLRFKSRTFLALFLFCCLGSLLTFALGLAWLSRFVGVYQSFTVGLFPFILPGFLKAFILSGLLRSVGWVQEKRKTSANTSLEALLSPQQEKEI